MCNYAYIRVSSREQNVARQVEAMLEIGIKKKDMFIDKQSGKDFNREKYQKLLRRLKSTDVVYIKSIDRLGRNYEEIIEQWKVIKKCRYFCIRFSAFKYDKPSWWCYRKVSCGFGSADFILCCPD